MVLKLLNECLWPEIEFSASDLNPLLLGFSLAFKFYFIVKHATKSRNKNKIEKKIIDLQLIYNKNTIQPNSSKIKSD